MHKVVKSIICIVALLTLLHTGLVSAEEITVEKVDSTIDVLNYPSPEKVTRRMEKSIQIIGEQILLGHKAGEIGAAGSSYERLIKEVFDRVLVGYSVDQVRIFPGSTTRVAVTVVPWGDIVREVELNVEIAGLPTETQKLVRQDVGKLQDKVDDVLLGLPVDAVEWASGISKSLVREILTDQLPEFRANFEVTPGARTVVTVSLVPTGVTVQDISVGIHSRSIPNFLLLEARPSVEKTMELMRGLPVEFVERHKAYFLQRAQLAAAAQPITERYGLTIIPSVRIGPQTQIMLDVETQKYKIWLEGYLDMNRSRDNTSVKGHIGKVIGKSDEIFTDITFVPSSIKWTFEPGWGHQLTPATTAGVKFKTPEWRSTMFIQQELTSVWSLRLERVPELHHNELGIRYKIHDFLSAEYIINSEENWLRLVGNL